jgi:hypothetical protein
MEVAVDITRRRTALLSVCLVCVAGSALRIVF